MLLLWLLVVLLTGAQAALQVGDQTQDAQLCQSVLQDGDHAGQMQDSAETSALHVVTMRDAAACAEQATQKQDGHTIHVLLMAGPSCNSVEGQCGCAAVTIHHWLLWRLLLGLIGSYLWCHKGWLPLLHASQGLQDAALLHCAGLCWAGLSWIGLGRTSSFALQFTAGC